MKYITRNESCTPTLLVLIGMCFVFVYKFQNKILSSRCTQIDCFGLSLKRLPLSDENALEMGVSNA